jgi:hypothetical protein
MASLTLLRKERSALAIATVLEKAFSSGEKFPASSKKSGNLFRVKRTADVRNVRHAHLEMAQKYLRF